LIIAGLLCGPGVRGAATDDNKTGKAVEKIANNNDAYHQVARFMQVMQIIRRYYIDKNKVAYDKLFTGAIKGMLHALDPYSRYEIPGHSTGSRAGIGLLVIMEHGLLKVVAPFGNSPAYRAGIRPGDIIMKIDGKRLYSYNMDELMNRLKGKAGTAVILTVLRRSSNQTLQFTIVRQQIKPVSIPANGIKIINKDIGYIKLVHFDNKTGKVFAASLKKLQQRGIKGLIIDLRNNSGGLVTAAISVCNSFLPKGKLIIKFQ